MNYVELFADEEEITFPPTYRFQKWTRDRYVWEKFKATGVSNYSDYLNKCNKYNKDSNFHSLATLIIQIIIIITIIVKPSTLCLKAIKNSNNNNNNNMSSSNTTPVAFKGTFLVATELD